MRLRNQTIIITGAAGDIGKTTAHRLATEGASLLLVDVNAESLEKARQEVEQTAVGSEAKPKILCQQADVTKEEDVRRYVKVALDNFGRIDGFFNNAGIQGSFKPVTRYDSEEFQSIINVNTFGVFLGVKHVGEQMRQQGHGSIVNTASLAGVVAPQNMVAYSASKFGVIGVTKSSSRDLASYGVRINCISPDLIGDCKMWHGQIKGQVKAAREPDAPEPSEAEMEKKGHEMLAGVAMGRLGGLEEVASVVSFLLSSDASYMTGKNIEIDGGRM